MKQIIVLFIFCISTNVLPMQWLSKKETKPRYQNLPPEWQQVYNEHDKLAHQLSTLATATSYASGVAMFLNCYKKRRNLMLPICAGLCVGSLCCLTSMYGLTQWELSQIPKWQQKVDELKRLAKK